MLKRRVQYILTITFVVIGILFYVGQRDTLMTDVRDAHELGMKWLFQNVRSNGLFVYSMDPKTGEVSRNNNAIRQLMASRVLAQESSRNSLLQDLHKHNLNFLFTFWYHTEDNVGYVLYNNKSKLGANAMLLRVLVFSPFFDEYQQQAQALAEGIHALQNEDGSFNAWYIPPSYEYDEERLLTFYSGEALLALVEYYEKTENERYLDASQLTANFYINKYVTNIEENYYPAYVPWHTLAYNKLYKNTGDIKYADAIFTMNDKLLELQDTTQFRGRFFNTQTPQYGTPHGSSDAVYTEGLAYAYEIAELVGDKEREKLYKNAINIAVYNLRTLQYKESSQLVEAEPEEYVGALRTQADSTWIRVDTTQHAIDAFSKMLEVL